jgi:hypothetical protein
VVGGEVLELVDGDAVLDEEEGEVADDLGGGVTLTMSPKARLTSAYMRAISGQRGPRPMLSACSRRLVYWPPGISWR